jgi:Amt family ammonium transporter
MHGVIQPMLWDGASGYLMLMLERVEGLAGTLSSESTFTEELLDAMPDATAIMHEGRIMHVNREFTRLFGFGVLECVGADLDAMLMPEGRLYENEMIHHALRQEGRSSLETMRRTRDGDEIAVWLLVKPVRLGGESYGLMASYRDIRKQKVEQERLRHHAVHDALTGLANRGLFLDRVQSTLARLRRRPDRPFAVIFLDLDGFKLVNDTFGHHAGDMLLLEMSQRLSRSLRPQDTVARLGGDEFALLLDECGDENEVRQIADRLQEVTQDAFFIEGCRAQVSASMGIVKVEHAGRLAEGILADADLAMYRAKSLGKAGAVFSEAYVPNEDSPADPPESLA